MVEDTQILKLNIMAPSLMKHTEMLSRRTSAGLDLDDVTGDEMFRSRRLRGGAAPDITRAVILRS